MKKKLLIFTLIGLLLIGGGITAYKYLEEPKDSAYSNGLFVDGGVNHGYAKVYYLCESL